MRRALRLALVALVASAAALGLVWVVGFSGPAPGEAVPRRELLLAMLTLGVLGLAAYGFDLRDWF